ncbi:MAG: tRNA preQ1(34) S-adenosylmethionine ribosyltransferase-isomerase QueA [Gammaproteobacteria bacterium]|nr:MAG: tRNA preQ1(34) S-adenosylmethionine ribosyltransferase-isomerase QueA [Gammaproteobacteria bacterium]
MLKQDFDYNLPDNLIAQTPPLSRTSCKMLVINRHNNKTDDRCFTDILSYLKKDDVLVLNDTKVIPARLFVYKKTGGKVEILLERILTDKTFLCHISGSKKIKINSTLISHDIEIKIRQKIDEFFVAECHNCLDIFHKFGHMPLPPYIKRDDNITDKNKYQTVFAKNEGAVAAPTAGLHFDNQILEKIKKMGVKIAKITLHIGSGTFLPMRVDDIKDHKMHSERFSINQSTADIINNCKRENGRVICVGTTVVRALETVAKNNKISQYNGESDIFISPGFKFQITDALITNFHLPQSTLLMLVSAFANRDLILKAYDYAITKKYKFFSYGDACLIV